MSPPYYCLVLPVGPRHLCRTARKHRRTRQLSCLLSSKWTVSSKLASEMCTMASKWPEPLAARIPAERWPAGALDPRHGTPLSLRSHGAAQGRQGRPCTGGGTAQTGRLPQGRGALRGGVRNPAAGMQLVC